MIRRKNSRSLNRSYGDADEDVNPNSYVTNLSDCMLVVAVGLLVALVGHYGVDLNSGGDGSDQITGTEIVMDEDGDGVIDENFVKAGSVYYDETTGDYYMVSDE